MKIYFIFIKKMSQQSDKYTLFPINYHNIWDLYKKHLSSFWVVEEIRLSDDLDDWAKINDNEKFFIKNVLAFFASSDGIVNENLVGNFYNEIGISEVRQFYAIQIAIESIHSEAYSLLIDTYIQNTNEKEKLFNAIETIPAVKLKAEWAIKWISSGNNIINSIPKEILQGLSELEKLNPNNETLNFFSKNRPNIAQRLIAFICIEGIFFSGSFCAIYWLKSRGLLPGLCTANQFIARDENLHVEFAIELFKTFFKNDIDKNTVISIFKEAVEIEKEFVVNSLPVSLIGMNCSLMCQYIEYVADRWLVLLGFSKIYNNTNPFTFMELISVSDKTNFFEMDVSQYKKANVGSSDKDKTFNLDDDF